MPLTLYVFIIRELLKLLVTATTVLVAVMAIGFCIKPLSEGTLAPAQLAKVLVLMMPAMLIYAVPVAAAFASTLVFYRMAADNEITAAAVSGVSYRSILLPVALMGMGLTLLMFFLSNFVLPAFWAQAERTIQQDVVKIVIEQINNRNAVQLEDMVLYADRAELQIPQPDPLAPPDAPQPYQRAVLEHAAAGKLTGNERLTGAFTGELAIADFYRRSGRVYTMVKFTEATIDDPDTGVMISVGQHSIGPIELPQAFKSQPKLLSLPDLRQRWQRPVLDPDVAEAALSLRQELAIHRAVTRIVEGLATDGGAGSLEMIGPESQDVLVQAPIVEAGSDRVTMRAAEDQPIIIRAGIDASIGRRYEARRGRIDISPSDFGVEPRIVIRLEDVRVIAVELPTTEQRLGQLTLTQLRLPDRLPVAEDLTATGPLLAAASQVQAEQVRRSTIGLVETVHKMRRRIAAAVHERAAMAVSIMLVLILGAAMSMLLRNQVPLAIFFWCFVPAIVSILLINSGQNVLRSADSSPLMGIAVIWSSLLMLGAVSAFVYHRLQRN